MRERERRADLTGFQIDDSLAFVSASIRSRWEKTQTNTNSRTRASGFPFVLNPQSLTQLTFKIHTFRICNCFVVGFCLLSLPFQEFSISIDSFCE